MAEYTAGSASVPITPNFSDFHSQIAEELSTLDEQFAKAGDSAGASFGDSFSTRLKASFADLPNPTITPDADTAPLDAQLDEATRPRTATVKVNVDKSSLAQAKTALSGIGESGGKLLGNAGTLGAADAAIGLAPQALGAAVGGAGIGVSLVAAAADAGAFGAIAVPMFSAVTKAQAALTTAQAAYNKATTDAGRATALAAEKAALDGLTPSEKELATQLTAVSAGWKKFSDAEQPVVEGALTPWLQTAVSSMGLLTPLVDDGANAIQALGSQAQTALQSPFWATFSSTLGQTGEDALTAFGDAAGSVADGLAHLFVTFAPDIDKLLSDVPTLAGDFDTWAKNVTAGGLEDFFTKTFSHSNLSTLDGDLKDVGSFFTNVSSATQTMSPLAFSGLSVLLEAIGELPPDAVLALTALFLATKTIGAIGNIAGLANNVVSLGKTAIGAFSTAADTAEATGEGEAVGTAASGGFAEGIAPMTGEFTGVIGGLGAAGTGEATTAGTAVGGSLAGGFAEGAGAIAEGLTGVLGGLAGEGALAATGAGMAIGASFAGGFTEGIGDVGAGILGSLGIEGGGLVLLGAALAGGAIGLAFGTGVAGGIGLSSAKSAVDGLITDAKNEVANSGTWLQPAGTAAAQGFAVGFLNAGPSVQAELGNIKNWTVAAGAGSNAWLSPTGTQAAQGFQVSFAGAHAAVNSTVAQLKTWILEALPSNSIISLLTPAGAAVAQGFANGIVSLSSTVINAALNLATSVENTIKSALSIASPSKVTFGLGAFTGQGYGGGLLSTASYVQSAGSTLAAASLSGLASMAQTQSLGALSALGVPSIGAAPRLPGVSSPLSAGAMQMQVSYVGSNSQLADALVGSLRVSIGNGSGGDVQAHLGRGLVRMPS